MRSVRWISRIDTHLTGAFPGGLGMENPFDRRSDELLSQVIKEPHR